MALALPCRAEVKAQGPKLHIPAQSTPTALQQRGPPSYMPVLYRDDAGKGQHSQPVGGLLSPEQALSQMLGGTGAVFTRTGFYGCVVVSDS